jgi:hypothetical protein
VAELPVHEAEERPIQRSRVLGSMADDQDAGAKRASASTRTPTCVGEPQRPVPDGVSRVQDGVVFRAPDDEQIAKPTWVKDCGWR